MVFNLILYSCKVFFFNQFFKKRGSTNALKSDISNELKQAELTIVNGNIECVPYANKSIHSFLCKIKFNFYYHIV